MITNFSFFGFVNLIAKMASRFKDVTTKGLEKLLKF